MEQTKEDAAAIAANEAEMKALGITPANEDGTLPEKAETTVTPEVVVPEIKTEDTKVEPVVVPEKVEPQSKRVSIRESIKQGYEDKLKALQDEVDKYKKNPTAENKEAVAQAQTSIDEQAQELATKLNFDLEKTKAILEAVLKITPQQQAALSEEDKKVLASVKEKEIALEQQEIFNEEWTDLEKGLRTQFPNATQEQLDKAKATMKDLAYKDEYVEKEMDYILYKEKSAFDELLFSPKQKTFESGRASVAQEPEGDLEEFNPNWTPAKVEAWEKQKNALMDSEPEKVRIVSQGVERWE